MRSRAWAALERRAGRVRLSAAARARAGSRGRARAQALAWARPGGGVRGEQRAAGARVGSGGRAWVRAAAGQGAPAASVAHGPGRRAAWPERGPRWRFPVEGAAGWSRGQDGPVHARGREERKEREGEGRRGKKEKKMEKKKKKERKREREREREKGRDSRRDRGARSAMRGAWACVSAMRGTRGKTGMGQRKIWVSARFLGVSGSQAGDESR